MTTTTVTPVGAMDAALIGEGRLGTWRERKAVILENIGSAESRMLAVSIRAEDAEDARSPREGDTRTAPNGIRFVFTNGCWRQVTGHLSR